MNGERGETILIVEDDPGVALLERRYLERAGYAVRNASTAEEAMEKLKANRIALVLLDYRLPGETDGLDFYSQMKQAGYDLPVILVTGFGDESTVIKALRAGVRDYVTKSVEYLDYLPEAIQRVLKQVRTEGRLAEAEHIAHLGNWEWDIPSNQVTWSDELYQIFGITREAFVGTYEAFLERIHPDDRESTRAIIDRAFQNLESFDYYARIVRGDGVLRVLHARGGVVADESGTPIRMFGTGQDVTDLKRAEDQIREQATLLDKAHDAIMVRDLDGKIAYWNQGATRLYGWTGSEALGQSADELLYDKPGPQTEKPREQVRQKGEWKGELQQKTKEGRQIVVESHWTLVRSDHGQPKATLVINNDITDKKKLESQLLRNQRLESIGTLAGGIAHDLNNALTPIIMSIQMLERKLTDPDSRSLIDALRTSAFRGAEMVKQILSFARGVEGQRVTLQPRSVLKELGTILEHTLPKTITVEISAPKDLWMVVSDSTQMHQMLLNLAVNARDAMPQGGNLRLAAENIVLDEQYARMHPDAKPGPFVVLTVADTGSGIPASVIDRIFDPFFTTKEQGKGTGLGLATVLGIVKSHGGFINVYSDVGKGSKFAVYLPAAEGAESLEANRKPDELPAGHGELILIVDDEQAICEITRQTLETFGYQAVTAFNGAEALALFVQRQPEIRAVITDMMMPIMDGPATVRALRKLNQRVPIIAASGLKSDGTEAIANTVQAFLTKPYAADRLLTALDKALHRDDTNGHPHPSPTPLCHGLPTVARSGDRPETVPQRGKNSFKGEVAHGANTGD